MDKLGQTQGLTHKTDPVTVFMGLRVEVISQ